ncbi:uncharacterized protein BXZ73DRAFT_79436 [Epithele typhae]|uniref:uncharacterized protein n=1 Tax=Epithele typhae TaxID=378194 RepID=UPI002007723D|nr:uncharacterized protein BXZ73DRAFT_79436 [Epithele typhae]KAH9923749.1 hypothetical protein BXZ73DRAFT_79436 [Epithele typhae]
MWVTASAGAEILDARLGLTKVLFKLVSEPPVGGSTLQKGDLPTSSFNTCPGEKNEPVDQQSNRAPWGRDRALVSRGDVEDRERRPGSRRQPSVYPAKNRDPQALRSVYAFLKHLFGHVAWTCMVDSALRLLHRALLPIFGQGNGTTPNIVQGRGSKAGNPGLEPTDRAWATELRAALSELRDAVREKLRDLPLCRQHALMDVPLEAACDLASRGGGGPRGTGRTAGHVQVAPSTSTSKLAGCRNPSRSDSSSGETRPPHPRAAAEAQRIYGRPLDPQPRGRLARPSRLLLLRAHLARRIQGDTLVVRERDSERTPDVLASTTPSALRAVYLAHFQLKDVKREMLLTHAGYRVTHARVR